MDQLFQIIDKFCIEGNVTDVKRFGSGHINDTYLVTFRDDENIKNRVILQKMNKHVFKNPVEVMENIMNVTSYLRERIIEQGGDPERETMSVICTRDGLPYLIDTDEEYWRSTCSSSS